MKFKFAFAVLTFAMALYDIDDIMAEHGLSKDEAAEVLRVLKSGPTTTAADTLYVFSVFYVFYVFVLFFFF